MKAILLVALFVMTSALTMVESSIQLEDGPATSETQSGAIRIVDVPTYRVGDEWVYDTKFDVAQLLAQANVSASLNTLTGDTVNEVTDVFYATDNNGDTVLAYEIEIDGSFSSGNSGATLEGVTGRLEIDYEGVDILRARDLATITSDFTLDVNFAPLNLGFLSQNLGIVTFDNTYTPAKERHDFPLRNGDQWYMPFTAETEVTGSSDYFDPSEFDSEESENNSWQVVKNEAPSEDGDTPQYTGCDDSYKIAEWNETGVNTGFNWYCPAVRGSVWNRIINSAGFTIDWILKTYNPADSNSVVPGSSPGGRNTQIEVYTAYSATLPNSMEQISIDYSVAGSPSIPIKNTNLQLRYELADTIHNPTTDNNGLAQVPLNVSSEVDDTPSSDDHTSNGVVVYDPANKIVGATTVVVDLSVVGVDLVAQANSAIVERTRGGVTTTLSSSIGFNALPGDTISFSLPAQNRGVLTSPPTYMEIQTPDEATVRAMIPAIEPYSEQRVQVNWSVPETLAIGFKTMQFTVDPDQNVTADANRSNNEATLSIFIGRSPTGDLIVDEGKYTFENVTLNATASFDEDGGSVDCVFEIESRIGLVDIIEAPGCWTQWNWSNSGSWTVKVLVVDEELDTDEVQLEVIVLNRPPAFNLTHPESVFVESKVTVEAIDIVDIDTSSPSGQQVSIAWPTLDCDEGLTQPTCTFTPMFEGPVNITAVATDDDGAKTTAYSSIDVLNIAPTLDYPQLWKGGEELLLDENGTWHLNEDEVALLRVTAADSANDAGTLIIEWHPSAEYQDWTITSVGISSSEAVSWPTSGPHIIQVRAIDADGASSDPLQANIMIHNVAPTVTGLPIFEAVEEDAEYTLSVTAEDTASDQDSLEICWDFDRNVDVDNDGMGDNDCEMEGLSVSTSWSTVGMQWITVTVTDDDGESAQQSMNISVVNRAPLPEISYQNLALENLTEGDNLTISGFETIDSPSDKAILTYQWDASHLDTDLDGSKVGDVDYSGPTWIIEDLPAGTWTIVLTVIDDDGESGQSEITILVAQAPAEGFFETISSSVGTTTAMIIVVLGFVIVGLVVFLLFTRQGSSKDEDFSSFGQQMNSGLPAMEMAQPAAAPTVAPAVVSAPAAEPALQQEVYNSGPPLPASGLPAGWTMEQWNYYGEQWFAANQPAPAPVQPIVSQTPPTPASDQLSSLLDDLDF